MAFESVRATCSWPTSSEKRCGRYLRARTRYDIERNLLRTAALGPPRSRASTVSRRGPARGLSHLSSVLSLWAGTTMRLDKLTIKAQEALQAAHELAGSRAHQELTPEHVLAALLDQPDGIAGAILRKLGVDPGLVRQSVAEALDAQPQVQRRRAPTSTSGRRLKDAASSRRPASRRSSRTNTSPASTCCWRCVGKDFGAASRALKDAGVRKDALMKALAEVRGTQRVTDPEAEGKYQALAKYTRDLTELARNGKLDPGDRPRRGDSALDAGPVAPHQEQPGADRRPGRRQDRRSSRGSRCASRTGDVPESLQGQEDPRAGPGRADRRHASSAASSRTASRRCSRRSRRRRAASSCSSTSCTRWSARAAPRARSTPPTCSSPRSRAAICAASARRRSTSTASTSRRTRRSSAASSPCSWASRRSRTRSRSCAASRSATRFTTASASVTPRWSRRRGCRTVTSRAASFPTRRSTSSTRRRAGSRCRSTRAPIRSISSSGG